MNKTNLKVISWLTAISFSATAIVPAVAHEGNPPQEFASSVKALRKAFQVYSTDGTEEMLKKLDLHLSKSDETFVLQSLIGNHELPSLTLHKNVMTISSPEMHHDIEIVNAESGSFLIDGATFHYDMQKDLQANIVEIQKVMSAKSAHSLSLMSLFESKAYALPTWGWALIAAAVAGLATFFIMKTFWGGNDKGKSKKAKAKSPGDDIVDNSTSSTGAQVQVQTKVHAGDDIKAD